MDYTFDKCKFIHKERNCIFAMGGKPQPKKICVFKKLEGEYTSQDKLNRDVNMCHFPPLTFMLSNLFCAVLLSSKPFQKLLYILMVSTERLD